MLCWILCVLTFLGSFQSTEGKFLIGIGKADATGPAVETIAMGYARRQQVLNGVHTRLWARAYLIANPALPKQRIMFVVLESCMVSQAVSTEAMKQLKKEYDGLYTEANVAIAATHTHTGPGGYFHYFLYCLAGGGFSKETFTAQVSGIVKAIKTAHETAAIGKVRLSKGELVDAGINRSPTAYLNNPKEERDQYSGMVDTTMTQLQFMLDNESQDVGILNWFPVHCTSLNNTVTLISADNKGVAARLIENKMRTENKQFIASFAQSNSGDVSPNTEGAFCSDTGLPCDVLTSSCHERNELCHGRGPGWPDSFQSSYLIGKKQYQKAKNLLEDRSGSWELDPVIDFRQLFVNLAEILLPSDQSDSQNETCKPAMGYSFAAGTTDGPGAFDFLQGSTNSSVFWDDIIGLIKHPSVDQIQCQKPKPILLDTGEMKNPIPWQPEIVPIQLLRIDRLFILCFPGEITTMAGRRLRNSVKKQLEDWIEDVEVVISGLTNSYSSYVATFEEYQIQRYEGASTIFGPHTLAAYQQEFQKLALDMKRGLVRRYGVKPPEFSHVNLPAIHHMVIDSVPPTKSFGDLHLDVSRDCFQPGETANAQFWSGNPRNSIDSVDHTFLNVEMYNTEKQKWEVCFIDDDLCTKFSWRTHFHGVLPYSIATVSWTIPTGKEFKPGLYRLQHNGHARCPTHHFSIREYSGHSSSFKVLRKCQI